MADMEAGGRGSGRTTKMLRELGEGRSIVVVHTQPMRDHVRHIVHRLNAEDGIGRDVVVMVINHEADADRLLGLSCPVAVDHAFWDASPSRVAVSVGEILRRHEQRRSK